MEDKIWYRLPTNKPYNILPDVIHVNEDNCSEYLDIIQSAIKVFSTNIQWSNMWDTNQAIERIYNGEHLFIYAPDRQAKAFVWFKENYLYNFFVAPEVRKDNIAEKLIKHAYNLLPYDTFYAYTESWNKVTQNFTEKRMNGYRLYI
jgi:GNAT superfamily N-acetyltransferase